MSTELSSDGILADLAKWLTYARRSPESMVWNSTPVPLASLWHSVMREIEEASAGQPRDQAQSTKLDATVTSSQSTEGQAAMFLDVLQIGRGEGFNEEEAPCLRAAATACVAVALGIDVSEVSTLREPVHDSWPAPLGHVHHSRLPDPGPMDASASSFWIEASVIVALAGPVLERLIDLYEAAPLEQSDCRYAMAVLKSVEPDPQLAAAELERLRDKTAMFLLQPWLIEEIFRVAVLLEERGRLTGHELRTQIDNGRCGAVYPGDTSIRCDIPQHHARGEHQSFARRDAPIFWSGFAFRWARKQPVANLTGPVKALRKLSLGGPAPLAKKWQATLEAAWNPPLDLTGERFPTAWCQLSTPSEH